VEKKKIIEIVATTVLVVIALIALIKVYEHTTSCQTSYITDNGTQLSGFENLSEWTVGGTGATQFEAEA
jgi:hypothetical protein